MKFTGKCVGLFYLNWVYIIAFVWLSVGEELGVMWKGNDVKYLSLLSTKFCGSIN